MAHFVGTSVGVPEPPWSGWIETTGDALLILEAARQGIIPRVTRRLVESERKMIGSGSVFVFDEEESGIKRWTDGCFWSPSRILGNFLLYRETDKKALIRGQRPRPVVSMPVLPPVASLSSEELEAKVGRNLLGSLTDDTKYKVGGLMKKTLSLVINGVSQHLISYYKPEDVLNGLLKTPSEDTVLSKLDISAQYLDPLHFRVAPRVTIDKAGVPHYLGEAEELLEQKVNAPSTSRTNSASTSGGAGPSRAATNKSAPRFNPVSTTRKTPTNGPSTGSKPPPLTPVKTDWPQPYYMPPLYSSYIPHMPPPPDSDPDPEEEELELLAGDELAKSTSPSKLAATRLSAPSVSQGLSSSFAHRYAQPPPPPPPHMPYSMGVPTLVPAYPQHGHGMSMMPMMIPPPMPAAATAWNGGYATYSHSTAPPPDPDLSSDNDAKGSDDEGGPVPTPASPLVSCATMTVAEVVAAAS
ncbi:Gti1/Pac2 family-domain-containing protein [Auriculariales sp. MPI-PUGE-AT-0066]|nr:Gti1/Pac2 family-domain-containing protein [Auriculariales sp. MPI-PUGE-AT-0066]